MFRYSAVKIAFGGPRQGHVSGNEDVVDDAVRWSDVAVAVVPCTFERRRLTCGLPRGS